MRTRLVLLAVAALAVAGCGGGAHPQRAAIGAYITSVDNVEKRMAGPLREVSLANRQFARGKGGSRTVARLAASVTTLRLLRHRLALVPAPPQAAHLRTLLLALVDREVSLAVGARRFAIFVPRYQSALRPIQPASKTLKSELAASAKGAAATKKLDAEKAAALVAYARTLAGVSAALQPLDPPAVWRPTYEQQLASLTQLQTTAAALAKAIRTNAAAAIPPLLERFNVAAVSNQSVAAQKREIAAVNHYDDRLRAIARLARRVQLARAALQRKYG